MSITSVNQVSSGVTPMNQTEQDNHEKNIRKQITNLQEKVKRITYDREKTDEEKSTEKKELQEKIQSLNSELKQYQIQKRQEEAAKRQETARTQEAAERQNPNRTQMHVSEGDTEAQKATERASEKNVTGQTKEENSGFGDEEAGVIISISNVKEQVSYMKKIRTGLEGRMRTAETEQEKFELQERIDHVSQRMGEKMSKIADAIAENQRSQQDRKDKVGEILREQEKEQEARKEAMNVVIPNSTNKPVETDRRKENFVVQGKVSIT